MNATAAFFLQNVVFVYFFYGLAFFALGLVVGLETTRGSEFRFARALRPLAAFGILHGLHEWSEMFQIFAANGGILGPSHWVEALLTLLLVISFLALLAFGVSLLPDAERRPHLTTWRVAALGLVWAGGVGVVALRYHPSATDLLDAADVLARYALGIPSSLLASWALLRERRDFHARGMSAYGRDLLWAALGFFVYGLVGQIFTRPSLLFPSQVVNTTMFLRAFGMPVQVVRGIAAVTIVVTLGRALRAFEMESRIRLARANKARLEAQAAALATQAQRVAETEAFNAQLSTAARELRAMVEMARILSSTIDQDRLLADGLYQIVHSFETAGCSVLFLKRPDGGLELAGRYYRSEMPPPETLPPLTLTVAAAFEKEQATGAGLDGLVLPLDEAAWVEGRKYRTLAVPLHAKGQLFGGLALSSLREDNPFGLPELNLLMAFGQQLAASIENSWLYRALQERETRLEELVRQLVNAQEAERTRIARELHDETGQNLSAIVMGLAAVESFLTVDPVRAGGAVRELREMAERSIAELRAIMANLRPSQLDDLGLVPALRWYAQRYGERNKGLTLNLALERPVQRLPEEYETVLFRITQEALTNVARHAQAGRVDVELCYSPNTVRLRVADDGIGFEEGVKPRGREGWGLAGIRERVALVHGRCTIESRRGSGTCITVELPLPHAREAAAGTELGGSR